MTKTNNTFKLFLCKFTGEDEFIVSRSTAKIRTYFAAIGVFVIAIFIGCFISAYVFIYSLFQGSYLLSIPVGAIWSLVVVNMYLLLLYTVAPPVLPLKAKTNVKVKSFFTYSMFFRVSFITLLAIIIAQPLNVQFFGKQIQSSLANHIVEEKAKMIVVSDSILIKQEAHIFQELNKYIIGKASHHELEDANRNLAKIADKITEDTRFMNHSRVILDSIKHIEKTLWLNRIQLKKRDSLVKILTQMVDAEIDSDHNFINEIDKIEIRNSNFHEEFVKSRENLKKSIQDKINNYNTLEELFARSNFFIKQIQLILYECPASWYLTFFICLLFILPIVLKYQIRNVTNFYHRKSQLEHQIIIEEYNAFKSVYSKLLQENTRRYNIKSQKLLQSYLQILEKINSEKLTNLKLIIEDEYKNEVFQKYEYWADNPFRTIRNKTEKQTATENDFLKIIYPEDN